MSAAPHKIILDGTTYSVTNWDVDKALLTLVWLTKTFGEGFVGLLTSKAGSELLFGAEEDSPPEEGELIPKAGADQDDSLAMQEFMSKVIDRLDERTYVKYAKHIIEGVRIGTTKVNFSLHFVGKMALLHQLIFQVLRFQYGDFLGDTPESDL